MIVRLYTKPHCGLCTEAEAMLGRLQKKIRFEIELVNIEQDSSAYGRYWDKIPVVEVDGREVAWAPLDEKRLKTLLRT